MLATETAEEPEAVQVAVDLASGRFAPFRGSIGGPDFEHLQVLLLSGAPLVTSELADVLGFCPVLQKLDASCCGLGELPTAELWSQMSCLKILLLQKNLLAKWPDVERAASPPVLEWLAMYDNPITSQPEYQGLVLATAPHLLALDLRVLSDVERLRVYYQLRAREDATFAEPSTHVVANHGDPLSIRLGSYTKTVGVRRFGANSEASALPFRDHPPGPDAPMQPLELMNEARDELHKVRMKADYCSAVMSIQGAWKVYRAGRYRDWLRGARHQSAVMLQKCARKFLWKRHMQQYVQNFLADEEELDLLLNAKEMLTLRASKLVENAVRRWVQKRKERRTIRQAATIISRNIRGYLTRGALLRDYLQIEKYPRIYFPASCSWEALVCLNVARASCDMPPLPREHKFEEADVMAVRMADSAELPRVRSAVSRLLMFRNFCLLRPCHSGRYHGYLWDGPTHRIVDDCAPETIVKAYKAVRRRSANVNNICREVFLASCAPGPHPIQATSTSEGPFLVRKTTEPDFRELYSFGTMLGEGDFGIVYTCEVRPGPAWDEVRDRNGSDGEEYEDGEEEESASSSDSGSDATRDEDPIKVLQRRRRQQQRDWKKRKRRQNRQMRGDDQAAMPSGGLVVKMVDHGSSWWGSSESSSTHPSQKGKSWLLLAEELQFISGLQHQHIVKTHSIFVDDYFVYFVISRFACSLRMAIMQLTKFSRRGLPVSVAADAAGQLLSPLAYLHSHRIAHRGISPDNLVLDTANLTKEPFKLVIADLCSTARHVEDDVFLMDIIGAPEYWAPEVAACEYSHVADIWAAGVVIWFTLMKKLPFKNLNKVHSQEPEQPARMTRGSYDFLRGLLCKDPLHRIRAESALRHDWLLDSWSGPATKTPHRNAVFQQHAMRQPSGNFDEDGGQEQDTDDDDEEEETELPSVPSGGSPRSGSPRSPSPTPSPPARGSISSRRMTVHSKIFRGGKDKGEDDKPSNWGRPAQKARRLPEKKMRADERFGMGEKVTVSFDAAIQRCRDSGQEVRPFESYEWWTEDRCKRMGLDHGDPPCQAFDWTRLAEGRFSGSHNHVFVSPVCLDDMDQIVDATAPQLGRTDSAESDDDEEVEDVVVGRFRLGPPTMGRAETRQLFQQVKEGRCRLCIEDGRLCREVDILMLRIRSPSGKLLVGGDVVKDRDSDEDVSDTSELEFEVGTHRRATVAQVLLKTQAETLVKRQAEEAVKVKDDRSVYRRENWRLPSAERCLGAKWDEASGGLDEIRQALEQLVIDELRAKPDSVNIFVSGASEEADFERRESVQFPGIVEMRKVHYFDAVVNEEVGRAKLSRIGMPGERSFSTTFYKKEVRWSWLEEEECWNEGVQVRVETFHLNLNGFQPIPAKQLLGRPLAKLLQENGFSRPGMNASEYPVRTVARFAGEVARGQLRLCEPIRRKRGAHAKRKSAAPGITLKVKNRRSVELLSAKTSPVLPSERGNLEGFMTESSSEQEELPGEKGNRVGFMTESSPTTSPVGERGSRVGFVTETDGQWQREKSEAEKKRQQKQAAGALRLLEEHLTVRVRSAEGRLLIKRSKGHLGESGGWQASRKMHRKEESCNFPKVMLKNGEDAVLAVRKVILQCLRLAQALPACICFGQKKIEERQDRKAGLAVLVVHQDVDVQLGAPNVPMMCAMVMPGAEKQAEALGLILGKVPQPHPEAKEEAPVSRMLQELCEGPACRAGAEKSLEDCWVHEGGVAGERARDILRQAESDPALNLFLHEAWRLGSRSQGEAFARRAHVEQSTRRKSYRNACWLTQPLVSCMCETPRLVERFIMMLLRFAGSGGDTPLMRPVPFLPERFVKQASAAVCLQATWRAHRERSMMGQTLHTSVTLRRCALCIQRCWRWSLLKRRLELLAGAARAAQAVREPRLYIEERLLAALNLINGVNRYAPLLFESGYSFGCTAEDDLVLVVHPRKHTWIPEQDDEKEQKALRRASTGLPDWVSKVTGLKAVPADDKRLLTESSSSGVPGLYGLLSQGIDEPREKDQLVVPIPSIQHRGHEALKTGATPSPALAATGGKLTWSAFQYKTKEQAKRRCMMLFLCTFSALHRAAVPFVPKAMVQSTEVGEAVLRLWDVFGLTWAQGEKAIAFRLRQHAMKFAFGLASLNGRDPWTSIMRQEWVAMDRHAKSPLEKQERPANVVKDSKACAGDMVGLSSSGLTISGHHTVAVAGARHTVLKNSNTALPPLPAASSNSGRTSRGGSSTPRAAAGSPRPEMVKVPKPFSTMYAGGRLEDDALTTAIRTAGQQGFARTAPIAGTPRRPTTLSPVPKLTATLPATPRQKELQPLRPGSGAGRSKSARSTRSPRYPRDWRGTGYPSDWRA